MNVSTQVVPRKSNWLKHGWFDRQGRCKLCNERRGRFRCHEKWFTGCLGQVWTLLGYQSISLMSAEAEVTARAAVAAHEGRPWSSRQLLAAYAEATAAVERDNERIVKHPGDAPARPRT